MVIGEFYINNEMLAEGVEAMNEARARDFSDAQMVFDIYIAMAGVALRCGCEGEASIQ